MDRNEMVPAKGNIAFTLDQHHSIHGDLNQVVDRRLKTTRFNIGARTLQFCRGRADVCQIRYSEKTFAQTSAALKPLTFGGY